MKPMPMSLLATCVSPDLGLLSRSRTREESWQERLGSHRRLDASVIGVPANAVFPEARSGLSGSSAVARPAGGDNSSLTYYRLIGRGYSRLLAGPRPGFFL